MKNLDDRYFIVGVDGGATSTRGVLFDQTGETLAIAYEKGTNLSVYGEKAATRISNIVNKLCTQAKISNDMIDSVGLGLAAASNEDGRDLVFKEMDRLGIAQRTLILNDAEAAYELSCPGDFGVLVTVGTGVICIVKDASGKIYRSAGKGHFEGDIGSGYWIGRQAIMHLAANETSVLGDLELTEFQDILLMVTEEENFTTAIEKLSEDENSLSMIASMAKYVIDSAKHGNELALSIVQEATKSVAEYLIDLLHEVGYKEKSIVLAGNGSVIRNDFYRKVLNDALQFDFPDVKWTFSKLSPAYGAGLLSAKLRDITVHPSEILKGEYLATTTR